MADLTPDFITITGARENNLKGVSLRIPKGRLTVFTGLSGSGKSSIVFDTIAVESQRQLNETFTWFVRNRLPKYERPHAEALADLSPAIVVDQPGRGGARRLDHRPGAGPDGGRDGGRVIFEGTPRRLLEARGSLTTEHLRRATA